MFQIRQTEVFSRWLADLKDRKAKARILARLESVRLGNMGDFASVGGGVHEFRVHFGPGYRIYFAQQRKVVVILLCAGDKSTQSRDITRAKRLLHEIESE
jgi:putative addiction module killer protein